MIGLNKRRNVILTGAAVTAVIITKMYGWNFSDETDSERFHTLRPLFEIEELGAVSNIDGLTRPAIRRARPNEIEQAKDNEDEGRTVLNKKEINEFNEKMAARDACLITVLTEQRRPDPVLFPLAVDPNHYTVKFAKKIDEYFYHKTVNNRGRKNRHPAMSYVKCVVREVKRKFPLKKDKKSDRLCIHDYANRIMEKHGMRPSDIAAIIYLVVEESLIPGDEELEAKRLAATVDASTRRDEYKKLSLVVTPEGEQL